MISCRSKYQSEGSENTITARMGAPSTPYRAGGSYSTTSGGAGAALRAAQKDTAAGAARASCRVVSTFVRP
jgi:hypothetical protein